MTDATRRGFFGAGLGLGALAVGVSASKAEPGVSYLTGLAQSEQPLAPALEGKPMTVQAPPLVERIDGRRADGRQPNMHDMAKRAAAAGQDRRARVMRAYAEHDLMGYMPFLGIQGGAYAYISDDGQLPGVELDGIKDRYSARARVHNPQVERLRLAGGDVDVDDALIRTHGEFVRGPQERLKAKVLGGYLAAKFIHGDHRSDPREYDGLNARLRGPGKINAGGRLRVSVLNAAIEQVLAPTHLIMSKKMRKGLIRAGLVQRRSDEYGRLRYYYDDLPILIAGQDDQGREVLGFDEPGGGGSLYVVSLSDSGVCGLQNGAPEVSDIGKIDLNSAGHPAWCSKEARLAPPPEPEKGFLGKSTFVHRTRVEWLVSLAVLNGRAAVRVHGVQPGTVINDDPRRRPPGVVRSAMTA